MGLAPGRRIANYEIVAPIGAGGMGEVFRARDIDLGRDVALKLLPAEFASDPERLARFEREARTLASLNHPHIAQIYGVAAADGVRAIVMELVDGEDLAERLRRGRLPLDEALAAARQVAEALEAAHNAGVVHRDLKPANIRVKPDGTVKVLDFGLAKLAGTDEGASAADSRNSPTMTSPVMTRAGVILGTAAYMSPEQAKGRAVDKRADVWAFGCVLFELLTGRRPFAGDDVTDTLAAILKTDPQWSALPAGTPEPVHRLVRRCLVKDLRHRLPDIAVARLEIDDALAPAGTSRRSARFGWIVALGLAIAGALAGAIAAALWSRQPPAEVPERVVQVTSADDLQFQALAPDGHAVVFTRQDRLVVRSMVSGEEKELKGADGAANPFWSPDSKRIGYFRQGDLGWELRVISADGSGHRTLAATSMDAKTRRAPYSLFAAAWCRDGIVMWDSAARAMQLLSEAEGNVIATFETPPQSGRLAYPHCLSDGRILAVRRTESTAAIVVAGRSEQTVLDDFPTSGLTDVRYPVLVGSDHVVFERSDPAQGLWALPVSADLKTATGKSRLVLAGATRPSAAAGLLTAIAGTRIADRELVWVDRQGKRLGSFGKPQREFRTVSLKPDATRAITGGRRGTSQALWMHGEDTVTRWIDEPARWPAWSPDGKHIAYVSLGRGIVIRAADGTMDGVLVTGGSGPQWTSDNKSLVFFRARGQSDTETATVWVVDAMAGATPRQILEDGREASVSPNRKLIAYTSQRTGREELYLTTFPQPGEVITISNNGGRHPRWTQSGTELFYGCGGTTGDDPGGARAICLANVDPVSGARRGPSAQLFDAWTLGLRVVTFGDRGYDIVPDGSRLLLQTRGITGTPTITMIENVEAWLRRSAQ